MPFDNAAGGAVTRHYTTTHITSRDECLGRKIERLAHLRTQRDAALYAEGGELRGVTQPTLCNTIRYVLI